MTATHNLLRELARRGHRITVYSTRLSGSQHSTEVDSLMTENLVLRQFRSYVEGVFFSPSLVRHLAASDLSRFDVIYVINSRNFTSNIALLSGLRARDRLVFSAHGSLLAYPHVPNMRFTKRMAHKVQDPFLSKLLRQVRLVIAVSKAEAEDCVEFGIDRSRIHVIGNGVDRDVFKPGESTFRRRLGIEDEFLVCYVGRLDPIKGLPVLLEAFESLLRVNRRTRLAIIGPDFGMKQSLIHQAVRLNIRQYVFFLEEVTPEELVSTYRAADVLVIPSYFEVFGMAALEAIACGTPVVASNVGGLPEIVQEGVSGHLVPPGDPEAIASKLLTLARNPGKKSFRIGTARIAEMFDIKTVGVQAETILNSLSNDPLTCVKRG